MRMRDARAVGIEVGFARAHIQSRTGSTSVSLSWQQCVRIAGIARAMTVTDAVGGIAYARGRAGIAKQASGGTQRPASDRNAVVQQKHA